MQRVGTDQPGLGQRGQERRARDDAAMRRPGAEDHGVKGLGPGLPVAAPPDHLDPTSHGPRRNQLPCRDRKPALGQQAIQHRLDLRRDAKAVDIPPDPQPAHQNGALIGRQRGPDRRPVAAHIVQRRLPRQPGLPIAAHGLPDAAQQRKRGACRIAGEIGRRLGITERMAARPLAPPRQRGDRAGIALPVEAGDDIGRGQPGADHQHIVGRLRHVGQASGGVAVGDQMRRLCQPGKGLGDARRRMAGRDDQNIGGKRRAIVAADHEATTLAPA